MIKAAIFDLDGTLLNTLTDLAAAGNFALTQLGLPAHQEEKYKMMVGNGIPTLIKRMLPENSTDEIFQQAYEIFNNYYHQHLLDFTKPYDGIIECLDSLRAHNLKLAVVTNKSHVFAQGLIKDYFGERFAAVEGEKPDRAIKPDPAAVLDILNNFGVEKSETVYVGDSNVDMMTAKNAGLTAIGVLWGFRTKQELIENKADYLAENPQQLAEIILTKCEK